MEQSGIDQSSIDELLNEAKTADSGGPATGAATDAADAGGEPAGAGAEATGAVEEDVSAFVDEVMMSLVNTLLSLTQKNVESKKEGGEVTSTE